MSNDEVLELFGEDVQEPQRVQKTPAERQAIRLANRIQVRQERRHHQRLKQQAAMARQTGLMLFDAVPVANEPVEPEEGADERSEEQVQKQKFPDMCSKINCEDFAEVIIKKDRLFAISFQLKDWKCRKS